MGAPITELIIDRVIRYGLQELHDYPSKIDMLFEKVGITALEAQYGNKLIDSIKEYVLANKISVLQAWPISAEKVPCYSILLSGTEEIPNRAFFGDDAGEEETLADINTLLTFVPTAYDEVTGFVSCPLGIDLSSIYIGAIFIDGAGSQFEIIGPIITEVGQERFAIAINSSVTIGDSSIIDRQNWDIAPVHETPFIENIQIGVHSGENTNLCKYLTYLLMYFLQSRRLELENVGVQIHTFTITDFHKNLDLLPDNVLTRFVNLKALVWFSWKEDVYHSLTGLSTRVKVNKDEWINTGDDTVITTDGTEPIE